MKYLLYSILSILFFFSCNKKSVKLPKASALRLEEKLKDKIIEPTIIFNNLNKIEIHLFEHYIKWSVEEKGLNIQIDEMGINTINEFTLNKPDGHKKDEVNFANHIHQIKLYETDSLIGFTLNHDPCTGLGCSVFFHLLYDLKSNSPSYFGRFKTGYELDLYHLNSDSQPDYISKALITSKNANGEVIQSIEETVYSQNEEGYFKKQ